MNIKWQMNKELQKLTDQNKESPILLQLHSLILIGWVFGNVVLILVARRTRSLQTPTYCYLVSPKLREKCLVDLLESSHVTSGM